MTAEEIVIAAMARAAEHGQSVPATRSLAYRRISYRQRELFVMAAQVNGEFFGRCAEAPLDDGAADLADITNPVATPETIQRIVIGAIGTSGYVAGQDVSVVAVTDIEAGIPPRVTIRDRIIEDVEDELADVVSIMVYYSRLPFPIADGDTVIELPEPWEMLLELDLARYLLRKDTHLPIAQRGAGDAALAAEEAEVLKAFVTHVKDYAPTEQRFMLDNAAGGEGN